jgi:hypothetical protein
MMTMKTPQTPKTKNSPHWPFPVRNGERTEASKSLLKDGKRLLRASKRLQRPLRGQLKRDACEDMPEALF